MHSTIERPDHDDTEQQTVGMPVTPGGDLTRRPSSVRRSGTTPRRFAVLAAFVAAAVVAIVAISVVWRATRAVRTGGADAAQVENAKSAVEVPGLVELPPFVDLTDAAQVPGLVELPPLARWHP